MSQTNGTSIETGNEGESNATKRKPTTIQIDPLSVTEKLGFQTFRRESRRPWTKEEDEQLINIMKESHPGEAIPHPDQIKWDVIAQYFVNTTQRKPKDCRKRWSNSLDPNLKKGRWTETEDSQLVEAYGKFGAQWKKVAAEIKGRTDDQCAKRYIEVLDPKTKDRLKPWTHEEDLQLIRQVKKHGTKWKTIASEIDGRPSLTCRNRWRKVVTDVVRNKAPALKEHVEMIREAAAATGTAGTDKLVKLEGAANTNSTTSNSYSSSGDVNTTGRGHELGQMGSVDGNIHRQQSTTTMGGVHAVNNNHASAGTGTGTPPVGGGVSSEVEWKYTLTGENNNSGSIFHEGPISSQELVQYLVSYAKSNGLNITVHQHIHHHYLPPQSFQQPFSATLQSPFSSIPELNDVPVPASTGYYVEPETQLNRYQHFNYLPPLTEVPKLNSSASSPSSSREGHYATPHPHSHPHPHAYSKSSTPPVGGSSKESDIMRLLNGRSPRTRSPPPPRHLISSGINKPLTPLAHAVELAAEEEAEVETRNKRAAATTENPSPKRSKHEEEDEEGLDFWETMRNLTTQQENSNQRQVNLNKPNKPVNNQPLPHSTTVETTTITSATAPIVSKSITGPSDPAKGTPSHLVPPNRAKPVSQHHPLHHQNGPSRPAATPMYDNEDVDEDLEAYGLFYNVYTRESSSLPVEQNPYDSLASSFGVIPFNPS
ncbi:myb-like DNA-binding protein Bas1p [[Candida] anglica]